MAPSPKRWATRVIYHDERIAVGMFRFDTPLELESETVDIFCVRILYVCGHEVPIAWP